MPSKLEYFDESDSEWKSVPITRFTIDREWRKHQELEGVIASQRDGQNYLQILESGLQVRAFINGELEFYGTLTSDGNYKNSGELELEARSLGYRAWKDRLTIEKGDVTSNEDVIEELAELLEFKDDNGDTVNVTVEADTDAVFDIPNYASDEKAQVVRREMEDWFNNAVKLDYRSHDEIVLRYVSVPPQSEPVASLDTSETPAMIDSFEPNIEEDIISAVLVVGTNENGEKIEVFKEDTSADVKEFKKVQVDFDISESEAERIAENLLNPDATTETKLTVRTSSIDETLFLENLDFTDEKRTDNETLEMFALKESISSQQTREVKLETAPKLDYDDIDIMRGSELERERSKLITRLEEEYDGVDFDGETGDAFSDTDLDGSVDSDPSDTDLDGSVDSDPSDTDLDGSVDSEPSDTDLDGEVFTMDEADVEVVDSAGESFNESIGNEDTSIVDVSGISMDATYHIVGFSLNDDTSDKSIKMCIASNTGFDRWLQKITRMDNVTSSTFEAGGLGSGKRAWIDSVTLPVDGDQGGLGQGSDSYELRAYGSGSTSTTVSGTFYVLAINHSHSDSFVTNDNSHPHGDSFITDDNSHPHGDSFLTNDNNHDHGDSFITEDDPHGGGEDGHGASGKTDNINIEIEGLDKVSR